MTTTPSSIRYPSPAEVDAWLDSIWSLADATACPVKVLPDRGFTHQMGVRHTTGRFVELTPVGMPAFYGYWQPAISSPAPLLVHVPGYGAEMSAHPELVSEGFHVLHISPLGYATTKGADPSKASNGVWPVLPDTLRSGGQKGYREWLANVVVGIRWAQTQPGVLPNRVSFFGTSQGGGASLLLGSLYHGHGARAVAADLPFLTDFQTAAGRGAYQIANQTIDSMSDKNAAWHTAGLIDTLSHVQRLRLPVLLTAGGIDPICPADTIENLFARLTGTKSYTYFQNAEHDYTPEFLPLAKAWFRLYA